MSGNTSDFTMLRHYMRRAGYRNVAELAKELGIPTTGLYRRLSGATCFSLQEVVLISDKLDMSNKEILKFWFGRMQ